MEPFTTNFIYTHSGRKAGPAYPAPPLHDVGVSLGRICRFAGHGLRFWSVLQHVFVVAELVSEIDSKAALLHDASESLIGDIPTPFKLKSTREMEERILMNIYSTYLTDTEKLSYVEGGYTRVKYADQRAFVGEVHVLGNHALRSLYTNRDHEAERLVRKYIRKYSVNDCIRPDGLAVVDFVRRAT